MVSEYVALDAANHSLRCSKPRPENDRKHGPTIPTVRPRRAKSAGAKPSRRTSRTKSSSGNKAVTGAAVGIAITFVVVVVLTVLRDQQPTNAPGSVSGDESATVAAATVNTGAPVSDDECQAFAAALEQAVINKNQSEILTLMNFGAMLDKCMAGIDVPSRFQQEFHRGAMSTMPQFAQQISQQAQGGSYKYLRTLQGATVKQVLFRLHGEAGLNYHRFDLIRNSAGQVVSGDVYIFATGEYLSTTFRRVYLPAAADASRSLISRLTESDNAILASLPKVQQLQQAAQNGHHDQALQIFKAMPAAVRAEKYILLFAIKSASEVSDAEYVSLLEELKANYPNDVCLDLLFTDYYLLKKRLPEYYAALDRLDRAVGGDPFIECLRATIMLTEGRHAEARNTLTPLLNDERFGEDAHVSMLDVDLAEQNHSATLTTLRTLRDDYGYEWKNFEGVVDFAEFVKSAEYQEWASDEKNNL